MKLSTPSGRCGPCCSTAASGSTAIQRSVAAPATSCQVICSQSRFGSDIRCTTHSLNPSDFNPAMLYCRVCREQEQRMAPAIAFRIAVIGVAFAAAATSQTAAQGLDKVSFGTNWVAEGEHGGFYQALADGTYRKYGLDVTIVPGGPSVNNRILLPVGKIDFFMSANLLQAFDAVAQKVPTISVAAMFQKDPQVLLAHPDAGVEKFEDLKKLTLFVSKEGIATYFQWMKSEFGFSETKVKPYTFNPQPFLADRKSAMQGYVTSEPYAIEKRCGFKPKIFVLADDGFETDSTL